MNDAMWKISESGQVNSAPKFEVNEVGLAMQLGVLFIAICLTFLYNKTENTRRVPAPRKDNGMTLDPRISGEG